MGLNIGTKKDDTYDKHLTSGQAVGSVNVEVGSKDKGFKTKTNQQEVLAPGIVTPTESTLLVRVGGGMTVNLGNYESARIDVSVQAPATKEILEETYSWLTDWVSEKIQSAVKSAKGQ